MENSANVQWINFHFVDWHATFDKYGECFLHIRYTLINLYSILETSSATPVMTLNAYKRMLIFLAFRDITYF